MGVGSWLRVVEDLIIVSWPLLLRSGVVLDPNWARVLAGENWSQNTMATLNSEGTFFGDKRRQMEQQGLGADVGRRCREDENLASE